MGQFKARDEQVVHQSRIVPSANLLLVRVPTFEVSAKRTAHFRYECARLLQSQREPIQLLSQFAHLVTIACVIHATVLRALQQELYCSLLAQQFQLERVDATAPMRRCRMSSGSVAKREAPPRYARVHLVERRSVEAICRALAACQSPANS